MDVNRSSVDDTQNWPHQLKDDHHYPVNVQMTFTATVTVTVTVDLLCHIDCQKDINQTF